MSNSAGILPQNTTKEGDATLSKLISSLLKSGILKQERTYSMGANISLSK